MKERKKKNDIITEVKRGINNQPELVEKKSFWVFEEWKKLSIQLKLLL